MRWTFALLLLPLIAAGANPSATPYREALPGDPLTFPRDHFEHPEFRTEWWYYTGNVWTADHHRFGFELVFFREGARPGPRDNPSTWRIDDLYLANAALTDVDDGRFLAHERLNRAGPGIAGARFAERRIFNANWSVQWDHNDQTLAAFTEDFSFHLHCVPTKPFVIQGEHGVSQKAAGVGRASHYVSFPRLRVKGDIQMSGRQYQVSGQAWMDHEWFTHQLEKSQTGWDWFSVQLNNNTELMLFDLRRKDGSIDPFSSGTYVDAEGASRHLTSNDFSLKPTAWWRSPKTGARYPVVWSIAVPSLHLHLECRAAVRDQQLANNHGAHYWEGAVDYSGTQPGVGYLEMTGYDKPMRLE